MENFVFGVLLVGIVVYFIIPVFQANSDRKKTMQFGKGPEFASDPVRQDVNGQWWYQHPKSSHQHGPYSTEYKARYWLWVDHIANEEAEYG